MRILSAALIFALLPFTLRAQDADDAGAIVQEGRHHALKLADATFLGVITDSISLERAGDLSLSPGTGLSVVQVAPGSPAAKAGFQADDVLAKLDDQILVNPAQLRVLVRTHAAADTLAFQIIRKGKAQTLKTGLGTLKLPELRPGGEEPRMLFPHEGHGQLNTGPGGIRILPFGNDQGQLPPEILQQLSPEMRTQVEHAQARISGSAPAIEDGGKNESGEATAQSAPGGGFKFSTRCISKDNAHTIEIEHGTHEHMNITDSAGKQIYNGKIPATDEEWQDVPEAVRAKAKAMAANRGVHIRLGEAQAPAETEGKEADDKPADAKPGQSF